MRNSNRYTFSFIPHVCYFLYHLWIAASKDRIITSLFSTKMRGEGNTSTRTWTSCPILLEFRHTCSPPICKKHTKQAVDKKIQVCETLKLTEGICILLVIGSKQSVSRLLTGQNNFFGGVAFKYVVKTIIHYYYCMLVKSLQ